MIKGSRPESALLSSAILDFVEKRLHKILRPALQPEPFYSGRDLYLLVPKVEMSDYTKLFCITVLKANKYRYSYGRQANITLPHLELMLPVDKDGKPDYLFMESYMKALPYGDRI